MLLDQAYKKPLKEIGWLRKVRYVLGFIWLGTIIVFIVKNAFEARIDFFYLTENFASVDNLGKMIFYYVLVIALLIAPIFLGKRAACHYICPMSVLNILGTTLKNVINLPSVRLKSSSSKCVNCRQCNKACPMSLKVASLVQNNMDNKECILCGECCKACKAGAVIRVYGRKIVTVNNIAGKL